MTRKRSEHWKYYKKIIPVFKALGELGDAYTLGIPDHSGWYRIRPENDLQNLKEGYQERASPYSLKHNAEELAGEIERHYYATLNYQGLDKLKAEPSKYVESKGRVFKDRNPLPNYKDISAFALFADIDIRDEPKERPLPVEKKQIFEKVIEKIVAEFSKLVGRDQVFVLDSVGGAYVLTAPGVTEPVSKSRDSGMFFREITERMNNWLKKISEKVLEDVEGADEICKIDAINNKNRQYKAPLSLHKKIVGVVHPIDTESIDYRLVIPDDVDENRITEVKKWCERFTAPVKSSKPIKKLISTLFSDFYQGDWRGALSSWIEKRREEEKKREKLLQEAKARREERHKKNINLEEMETTSNISDIIDALGRLDVREIVRKYASDKFDTSTRPTETTFNPFWRESESGKSCAIPHGENYFIDNKVNEVGGPVEAYALGMGILKDATEPLEGEKWWRAVEGLRKEGYTIPDFANSDSELVPLIAEPRGSSSSPCLPGKNLFRDTRQSQELIDQCREKTLKVLKESLESREDRLIEALPTLGKSRGIIKAAKEKHRPITIFTNRGQKEQYKQYINWCEEENLKYKVLPSFFELCPTAKGEHGEEWEEKVKDWYDRGLSAKKIHKYGSPPCQEEGSCPWSRAWNFEEDSYDVLIGHYKHSYLPRVTKKRTVVFDEFPEDAFEIKFSGAPLKNAISTFLKEEKKIPFQDYTGLLENREDEQKRSEALNHLNEWEDKDPQLVIDNEQGHALAPLLVKALLDMWDKEIVNGYERQVYSQYAILHKRDNNTMHILNHPNLTYSHILALDGTPTREMWEMVLGLYTLKRVKVLDDDERKKYLKKGLKHTYIRTTESTKPYSSGDHINIESDRILLQELQRIFDQKPSLITTKGAEQAYKKNGLLNFVDVYAHYGDLKGSNQLKNKRLGVVIGSQHNGDHYIKKWAAYMDKKAEREGKGTNLHYGPADNIYRHMTHHMTLQAVMRFGRDGYGATVYIETNTLPDWVPSQVQLGVVHTWSDGMKKVFSEAKKREEFRTKTIAKKIDLSKRQVRRCLNELEEKTDTLVKKEEGVAHKWINQGLNGINPGGDTELEGKSPYQSQWEGPRPPDGIDSEDGEGSGESSQMIIRVKDDIPQFMGYDQEYRLSKEDVLTIEESLGQVLISRGVATKVDTDL